MARRPPQNKPPAQKSASTTKKRKSSAGKSGNPKPKKPKAARLGPSLLEEFGGLFGLRKVIRSLRKKGIIRSSPGTRTNTVTRSLVKKARTYRPVAEGKSKVQAIGKKDAAKLKGMGYTVTNGKVILGRDEIVRKSKRHGTRVFNRIGTVVSRSNAADLAGDRTLEALAYSAFEGLKKSDRVSISLFGNRIYKLAENPESLIAILSEYGSQEMLSQVADPFGNAPLSFFIVGKEKMREFADDARERREAAINKLYQRRRAFARMRKQRKG